MEKLKPFMWPAALIIVAGVYYFHEIPLHERSTAYKVFGEYHLPNGKTELNLKVNNWYWLKKNTRFLSEGTFAVRSDTIELTDERTDRKMYLLFESEEKLIVIKVDSISSGGKFLCWLKHYPDGEVKFTGFWRNGEKHGVWQYFDQHKNRTQTTLYENGKVVQENYKYDFHDPDSTAEKGK